MLIALLSILASTQAAEVIDRVEAAVNSQLILHSDVSAFRRTVALRSQIDPLFNETALAKKGSSASDSEIVEYLVEEKVILSQFPVKDTEVDSEINTIAASNRINREQLRSALKQQGFSFEDYFEIIRTSVAKKTLIDRDIRTRVYISDEDVKNTFYNDNLRATGTHFSYRIRVISITPSNYKSLEAARKVAEETATEIRGGASFEDVAKRVSDDSSSSTAGGDLGFMSASDISPSMLKEVRKLKMGDVSPVFGGSSSGQPFFIIQLVDLKSSDDDRLKRHKDEIFQKLAAHEYQRQLSLWIEREKQKAYVHYAGKDTH